MLTHGDVSRNVHKHLLVMYTLLLLCARELHLHIVRGTSMSSSYLLCVFFLDQSWVGQWARCCNVQVDVTQWWCQILWKPGVTHHPAARRWWSRLVPEKCQDSILNQSELWKHKSKIRATFQFKLGKLKWAVTCMCCLSLLVPAANEGERQGLVRGSPAPKISSPSSSLYLSSLCCCCLFTSWHICPQQSWELIALWKCAAYFLLSSKGMADKHIGTQGGIVHIWIGCQAALWDM